MIDYNSIIENLRDDDIFSLLEQLGGEPVDKGSYILSKTLCHNIDLDGASYKLYYYKNTHLFYCYSECGPLSIFKLLKNYYDIRQIEYDWYNDILQVILGCSIDISTSKRGYKSIKDEYAIKKQRKELPIYPNGILEIFNKYYPIEWLNDGISKEVMDKYNICFSTEQNKIIIPHYNINNELIGIRGRALNKQEIAMVGKYAPVWIEGKCYSHPLSLNLYGLNLNKDNIKKYGVCFLSEGEKSVLQAENFQMPNCTVATCGSNLNKFQIDLLVRYCHPHEIIVCYDNEEKSGEDKYFNKLYNMCKKYTNYANMSFIYDRNGLSKMKDSPLDNGQEIFNTLVQNRVKVK